MDFSRNYLRKISIWGSSRLDHIGLAAVTPNAVLTLIAAIILAWAVSKLSFWSPLLLGISASFGLIIFQQLRILRKHAQLQTAKAELEKKVQELNSELAAQTDLLRAAEELHRRLFHTSPVPILIMDASTGKFTDCNQAALNIYRLDSRQALIGKTLLDFSVPRQSNGKRSELAAPIYIQAALSNGITTFQWRIPHSNGEFCDLEVHVASFKSGKHNFLQFTLKDITARLRAEVQREQFHAQLIESQKLETVGQLASGVAHDFNNILAGLMLNLGILLTEPNLTPELLEGLKDAHTDAERAANLVRQLLLFSRKQIVNKQKLELNTLVANMIKMLTRLIGEHVRIEFVQTTNRHWTYADAGMIEQVLLNLVVNSRDAMPNGGKVSIEIATLDFDQSSASVNPLRRPGRFCCLMVNDTGVGMDQQTLKRVFEPFFTTKAPGKGTGLGLSTVRGIVAKHEGWIEAESSPGQGATFRVLLPALTDHQRR